MGSYVYGLTANKKSFEGIGEVRLAKYIYKPGLSWGYEPSRVVNATLTRYGNAPDRGHQYVYAWAENEPVYKRTSGWGNTFWDTCDNEILGWLKKVGRSWTVSKTEPVVTS